MAVLGLAGCQAPVQRAPGIDELLHQSGSRHGTLGPTGKRLFADRLDPGLGVRGQFGYIHQADIPDPILLTIRHRGQTLPVRTDNVDWYPSHVLVKSTAGPFSVTERKFITDDDTIIEEMTLANASPEPLEATIRLASGFATQLERRGSSFTTVDLSNVANAHPFSGRDVFTGAGAERFRAWHEAEHAQSRSGTQGRDPKAAASGGECLGAGFGAAAGHYASYVFATPPLESAHLYVRAARGSDAAQNRPASWSMQLDGRSLGVVSIAPTSGWGDADADYHWVHLELGSLLPGAHTLRIESTREANNTSFDGFYVTADPIEPPASGAAEILARDVIEQVPYRAARQEIDGVPFAFMDPDRSGGRGVVMARCASDAATDTREIIIPIPGGRANLIHFCGQLAGGLDRVRPNAPLAEYELQFADGETERILLTAGDVLRPTWAGLSVLTHRLPAERNLLNVVFRCREEGRVILAAVTLEQFPAQGANYHLVGTGLMHDLRVRGMVAATDFEPQENEAAMTREIRLGAGESLHLQIAMSLAEDLGAAEELSHAWQERTDALQTHRRQYQAWFDDNCPSFDCDDPWITRLYWYRWFVARHCLSRAGTGYLSDPCFFAGRHGRFASSLMAHSSSQIIAETRWLRNPQYAFGQVRNHCRGADEHDHYFRNVRVNEKGGAASNWIARAAWEAFWVHPDTSWLKEVLSGIGGDVLGVLSEFDRDADMLPAPRTQIESGMPWQPSFFFFSDYNNALPSDSMERPEFAAYLFSNAQALADIYRLIGIPDETQRFQGIAAGIRSACLSKMWNARERFFYAIREEDNAPALVREIAGFYPYWTGLVPDEARYTSALETLVDPQEFWTEFPPSTASRRCPATSLTPQRWPAAGGRTGLRMWNGPAWPQACSMTLDVIATVLQDYHQSTITREHFWHLFRQYTRMQFESQDLQRPIVRESYDAQTGEGFGAADCFQSTYNDLIVRHLVGLRPTNGAGLIVEPIPGPVRRFSLRGIQYRGHQIDVVYNTGGPGLTIGPLGLTVWVNGRVAATSRSGRVEIILPDAPGGVPVASR